jgi:hypothetical protein
MICTTVLCQLLAALARSGMYRGPQLDTFHYLYPGRVSGKASPSGDPSGLGLRPNPNLRWLVAILIKRPWLIEKCGYGSYAADVDRFARKRIGPPDASRARSRCAVSTGKIVIECTSSDEV